MISCAPGVLQSIADHARRTAPHECCGLLIGDSDRIAEAQPVENRAADTSRRYEIDPRDMLAAMKRCRGTGLAVIGAYHSHPRSSAGPSASDLEESFRDFLYLIAGPVAGQLPVPIEAYRLEHGNFRPIRLVPEARKPET